MFSFVRLSWLNFRKSGIRRFTLSDTGVSGGKVVSVLLSTGATSHLVGVRKLGIFRDTEEDVFGSDDSDILWVDDAAEGTLYSMDQL